MMSHIGPIIHYGFITPDNINVTSAFHDLLCTRLPHPIEEAISRNYVALGSLEHDALCHQPCFHDPHT